MRSGKALAKWASAAVESTRHAATRSFSAAPPAFVFDIDGVLIQGRRTLLQAKRALAKLYTPDGSAPLYPLAFLTNGGGMTERVKAHQLSEWLGVAVNEKQVVLSHTPFRQLAARYADEPVLIAGRGQVREVARQYGFSKIVTTHQLARALPAAVPFTEDQGLLPGGDLPSYTRQLKYGSVEHPIRAVMVWTDPASWYRDLQLIVDVLQSRGAPGHPPLPDAPPVGMYFSNPDMVWANEFSMPRFGQGAFATALEAIYEKVAGEPLRAHYFGKPNLAPYLLAERLLLAQGEAMGLDLPAADTPAAAEQLGTSHSGSQPRGSQRTPLPFSAIFAVGDNPAADVRGANAAGAPWVSVLVTKTGVARSNCATDPAQVVVDDVEAAVDAALHRTRHSKWHSMR